MLGHGPISAQPISSIGAAAPQKQPTRGMIWRQFTAGDAVGAALAEWAYITPRYPNGLTRLALQRSSPEIQRETALFWFLLNYKPYDLTSGRYFGFAEAGDALGFDQGTFAPPPKVSFEILKAEFGEILRPEICHQVSENLPGQWMEVGPVQIGAIVAQRGGITADEATAAILVHLDGLSAAIRALAPEYGGIGHNSRPLGIDPPLTESERDAALVALATAKTNLLATGEAGRVEAFQQSWPGIAAIAMKLGLWVLQRLNDFSTELAKAAGKSVGEKLPWLIIASLASAAAWHEAAQIANIIQHFAGIP